LLNQAIARALEPDLVGRLARFFPNASPVRIPIKLSRIDDSRSNGDRNADRDGNRSHDSDRKTSETLVQHTVIEFGTEREVLFAVNQPLEFADCVLIESNDGELRAEASVVAVQYHLNRTVVAARFHKHVSNWIVKS
jgi:hypothetical protein